MAEPYARGIWARFAPTEHPFDSPQDMEDNLRTIDDHLAIYTLHAPLAVGADLPSSPANGDGQLVADGSYAVFNGGAWKRYPPLKGLTVMLASRADVFVCTGTGWASLKDALGISALLAGQGSNIVGKATLAELNADLAHPAGTVGWVLLDATPGNNIFYLKTGATGGGAWVPGNDSLLTQLQVSLATAVANTTSLSEQSARFASQLVKTSRRGWRVVLLAQGKLGLGINSAGRLILGVGGDILATITAIAGNVSANASAIASAGNVFRSSRRGTAILRVLDRSRTKVALEINRAGRTLLQGRDVLTELDVVKASTTAIQRRSNRTVAVALRDSTGKAPLIVNRTGRPLLWGRDVLAELDALKSGAASNAAIDAVRALVVPGYNLLVVGDSLSAPSNSWARTMSAALTTPAGSSRQTTSLAVGGQTSTQQAVRLGALPCLVTFSSNTILASGATAVTACQVLQPDDVLDTVYPITNQGPTWRARVSGVLGTFSSATWDEFGQPTACVFTADAGQLGANKVVDVGAPTESVWASGKEFDVLEIGIGRNNYPGGTDVNVINRALSIVKRDILAVIAWQRTAQKRFIIMTPPNGGGEGSTSNSVGFQFFLKLERWAAAQFGELVINSRQELMRRGDGGATDNAAIADGRVPPSLTTDGLHWTDTAQGYLRAAGAAVFNRRGW